MFSKLRGLARGKKFNALVGMALAAFVGGESDQPLRELVTDPEMGWAALAAGLLWAARAALPNSISKVLHEVLPKLGLVRHGDMDNVLVEVRRAIAAHASQAATPLEPHEVESILALLEQQRLPDGATTDDDTAETRLRTEAHNLAVDRCVAVVRTLLQLGEPMPAPRLPEHDGDGHEAGDH